MLFNLPGEMSEAGSESDYSDSSSISSTKSSYVSSSDELNELVKVKNTTFRLPKKLCENPLVFNEFFSMNTWRDLPENFQVYLKNKFLPHFAENNESEKEETLNMLFNDELKVFGASPLTNFRKQLEEGAYRPDVLKLRVNVSRARRREQRFQECERLSRLSRSLALSREKLLRAAYNAPPGGVLPEHRLPKVFINTKRNHAAIRANKRFVEEISQITQKAGLAHKIEPLYSHLADVPDFMQDVQINSTNENKITGTMCQKNGSKRFLIFETTINNDNLHDILLAHKRRKMEDPDRPEYETNDIRLRDVHARTQISGHYKKLSFKNLGKKSSLKVGPEKNDAASYGVENKMQENQSRDVEAIRYNETQRQIEAMSTKKETSLPNTEQSSYINENSPLPGNTQSNVDNKKRPKVIGVSNKTNKPPSTSDFVASFEKIPPKKDTNNEMPSRERIVDHVAQVTKENRETVNVTVSNVDGIERRSIPNELIQTSHLDGLVEPKKIQNNVVDLELTQDTHVCFFSLIRDIFCSTSNHRIHLEDLKEKVYTWLSNPITALNDWYNHAGNWLSLIDSAIHFLAGDFAEQPSDFVPYLEFKVQLDIYQWIGAGRDSDQHLLQLYNYWLARRFELDKKPIKKSDDSFGQTVDIEEILLDEKLFTPPPPKCPTQWTVQPYTPEEIVEFRAQEKRRFENPHRAFTYIMHGYESVVGPVKGIYTQMFALTKARGHNMLIADRPNFVTILTLVRDATARLPNGEGTRADICELLKSSQYINPQAQDSILQTIVSGALDRMHTEHDPCVRYDPKRKIWIYLHRNRTEEEFERLHQQHQGVGKHKKSANRKIKQKFPKLASSEDTVTVSVANSSLPNKILPTLSSIHSSIAQTVVTNPAIVSSSKIISKSQLKPELVPIKSNTLSSDKRISSEGIITTSTNSPSSYQGLPTLIVDNSLQKFTAKKAPPLQASNPNLPIGSIVTEGTVIQNPPALLTSINPDAKQVSITIPGTGKPMNYHQLPADRKMLKPVLMNENVHVETTSQGVVTSQESSNSNSMDNIEERTVKTLTSSANVTAKLLKSTQPIAQSPNNLKQINLSASAKNLLRVSTSSSQAGKSLISPHIAATNISLQQQKIHGNINLTNVSLQQNISQVAHTNVTTFRTQPKATLVNSIIRTNQQLSAFQQKQRQKTINLQNAVMISSGQVTQAELHGKQVIIPQQGNMQKQKTIICTGNGPPSVTAVSISSPASSTGSTVSSTLMTPQIIRIQQAIPFAGTRLQAINTTNNNQQDDKLQQAAKKQQKINQPQTLTQQSVIIKKQANFHQGQKQPGITTTATVAGTVASNTAPKILTPTLSTNVKDNSSSIINPNVLTHQTLTQVKQDASPSQQILEKPTQTVTRVIKPGGSIIHSLANVSGIRTQVGNPLLTKVITNNPAQIVSLESLLQKQGVNSTLRLASCKSNQANMLQLSGHSSQLPQYTVVSQGRNILSVSSAQRMVATSAGGNIVTSLSSISAGKMNEHGLTTHNSTVNQPQSQNAPKVVSNQIHSITSPQLVNTKVLGKTATGSIRMVNASNLNIAHIRGKPVIIASKPTNLAGQQGTQSVLLPNPISSGNVVIGAQTLKLQGNIITPANVQVLSQATSSQPQTVVLGNQIIKVQQAIPIKSQATTPVSSIITSTLNSTRVSTQPATLSTAITGNNHGGNNSGIASLASKTVVLGSTGQTFRMQPTANVNAQTACSTSQTQQMFLSSALKGANVKTTATGQQRVVLAVQGGGQILLPAGFQGGAINLKSVQGLKVISVTQQQNKEGAN